jgi:hypothetical protein
MDLTVDRYGATDWPAPMGDQAIPVFKELVERLEGIPHFFMGRTLLNLMRRRRIDPTDTDLDVGILRADEWRVRSALEDWPLVIRTRYEGETQQIMWYPRRVLVDVHLFGEMPDTVGYVSQRGKWVTRSTRWFAPAEWWTHHGFYVAVPADPAGYVREDYGGEWRERELKQKTK